MSDLIASKSVTIAELLNRIELHKYNPSTIQSVVYGYLDEITSGEVDIVDPTSPFVFLLECSAVNTAAAINETVINTRRLYPSLAQTDEELYLHLSDKDYLGRFANPVECNFTVFVQVNDILNNMPYSEEEGCFKSTLPRDTRYKIDNYIFTSQYPIDIRKYTNGVVQIAYDGNLDSPIDSLEGNIIDYKVRRDASNVDWLFFKVKVKQYLIESVQFPVQKSAVFKQVIVHSDQFYYIRAFYKNDSTLNKWKEFNTTHTDQVFDPFVLTASVQVHSGFVTVSIPPVYLTTGKVSGQVRFDVYCTKGTVSVNFSNYKYDAFTVDPMAIDEARDVNEYTNALNKMSFYTYCDEIVTGGSDGISFDKLRERVIYNATGKTALPITNHRLSSYVEDKGFDLVKNIDTVTNRVFLATQRLPKPMNVKLATSANIGISTFNTDTSYLKTLSTVKDNSTNKRLTILSNNLYRNVNGIITIMTTNEVNAINSLPRSLLVSQVNSEQYLYSPFYYVLDDNNDEFEVRAYNLDYPLASGLSFVSQNQSLQLPVNTGSYQLIKTTNGYRLTVTTKSGNFYKEVPDGQVSVQIAYYPSGESRLAYLPGILVDKTEEGERIFSFEFETNYDLNEKGDLCITNSLMFGNETTDTWVPLTTQFHIFYNTTSINDGFVPAEADALLGSGFLPSNTVVSTHETINIQLGSALKNLWCRSRSMASGLDYVRHEADVPMFYVNDVYQQDPATGSIFSVDGQGELVYTLLHSANDPVLDNQGDQVYKFRRGDVVTDINGDPVIANTISVKKEVDMLFVDGRHYFVNDPIFVNYNVELVGVLDSWITQDMESINDILLEQSRIYFYPKTTLGKTKVYIDDEVQDIITSEQSLSVDLYVKSDIYNDQAVRQQLIDNTVKTLDESIGATTINLGVITGYLKDIYGNSVENVDVSGLGGSKNYRVLKLTDEENRLALKKILVLQQDNTYIIKEDVTINFYKVM